jgi:hypothetical protein
MYVDVAWV